MTGTGDSGTTLRTAATTCGAASSPSGIPSPSTSSSLRMGLATTGPTFSTSSKATPIPFSGSMMSANITAASTSSRRTGCRVTSAQRSGSATISSSV